MEALPDDLDAELRDAPLMVHLGTCRDGRPHVAPVWFQYDGDIVEVITGGRKRENARENPRVALSVQRDDDGTAVWRATMRGTAEVVDDEPAVVAAAQRIYGKYPDGLNPNAVADMDVSLVRVTIGSRSWERYE